MCMEKDINNCHRKVILETLFTQGIKGRPCPSLMVESNSYILYTPLQDS